MKFFLISFIICLFTVQCLAQDPHFSQYHASPLTLNPAMTGNFDGDYRISGNYRQQYLAVGNPFVTGTISYDTKIMQEQTGKDVLAVGIIGLYDESLGGAFKSSNVAASLSYQKAFDEEGKQKFGIGFQTTYSSRSIDPNKLNYSNQFNGTGFDTNIPSNENFESLRKGYLDVNAGIIYTYSEQYFQAYGGVSLYHITKPNISFLNADKYTLPLRFTIHGGAKFIVGDNKDELFISGLYMQQAAASEKIAGLAYGFNANEKAIIYGGLWYRIKDAFIPYIGLSFANYRIGISYDQMTSDLKSYKPKNGSFEISLNFLGSKIFHPDTKYLQCPF